MLIGAQAFGWLAGKYTTDGQIDWKMLWLIPAAFAAAVLFIFIAFFHDRPDTTSERA
jgi:hypothetical protein